MTLSLTPQPYRGTLQGDSLRHTLHSETGWCWKVALVPGRAALHGDIPCWIQRIVHPDAVIHFPCKWQKGYVNQGCQPRPGGLPLDNQGLVATADSPIQAGAASSNPRWLSRCLQLHVWSISPPSNNIGTMDNLYSSSRYAANAWNFGSAHNCMAC